MKSSVEVGASSSPAATRRSRAYVHGSAPTPKGFPYFPKPERHDEYRLAPAVRTDWDDFRRLSAAGLSCDPPDEAELAAALELVRGRPFGGVQPGAYDWSEESAITMIEDIVDVAHALAITRTAEGDHLGARHAAAIGLTVAPTSELLLRDSIEPSAGPAIPRRSRASPTSSGGRVLADDEEPSWKTRRSLCWASFLTDVEERAAYPPRGRDPPAGVSGAHQHRVGAEPWTGRRRHVALVGHRPSSTRARKVILAGDRVVR